MKRISFILFAVFFVNLNIIGQSYSSTAEKVYSLGGASVSLKPSWIKQREDLNINYLKSLDADRLLHNFKVNAKLPSNAQPLGGWEEPGCGLRGHFTGHYLSAAAFVIKRYDDQELKTRIDYMIDELQKCQQTFGNGYLSAFPEKDFDILETRFGGVWAPYYTYNKILKGLLDVYTCTGNQKAYRILTGMVDYIDRRLSKMTADSIEKMLYTAQANPGNEPGAMNEVLYMLYKTSNNPRHLELAKIFDRDWFVNPLAENKDILSGLHSNTHIVLVNGFAQRYGITKEKKFYDVVANFWDMLIRDHAYVNGSSSGPRPNPTSSTSIRAEHWGKPGVLSNTLSMEIAETCVSHNTQKLSASLFGWTADPQYADAYMNTYYNAVLAAQNAQNGCCVYHLPLGSPRKKSFLKEDDFRCCNGSSIEAYALLNEGIYYHDGSNLWVNLYIPSEVNWEAKNMRLQQEGDFPNEPGTTLTVDVKKKTACTLNLFIPSWAKKTDIYINGEKQHIHTAPLSYVCLNREWNNKDEIKMVFDFDFHLQTMPDDQHVVALFYGPTLLAFEDRAEIILKGSPEEIIKNLHAENGKFKLMDAGRTYTLKPLYEIADQSYSVYATIRDY